MEELWLRSGVDRARLQASSNRSTPLGRLCKCPLPALVSVDALRISPAPKVFSPPNLEERQENVGPSLLQPARIQLQKQGLESSKQLQTHRLMNSRT